MPFTRYVIRFPTRYNDAEQDETQQVPKVNTSFDEEGKICDSLQELEIYSQTRGQANEDTQSPTISAESLVKTLYRYEH